MRKPHAHPKPQNSQNNSSPSPGIRRRNEVPRWEGRERRLILQHFEASGALHKHKDHSWPILQAAEFNTSTAKNQLPPLSLSLSLYLFLCLVLSFSYSLSFSLSVRLVRMHTERLCYRNVGRVTGTEDKSIGCLTKYSGLSHGVFRPFTLYLRRQS